MHDDDALPTEPFLTILDADRIHDYVFSPYQLRLIRGGSAKQLDLIERVLWEELASRQGQGIFAGGGTIMGVLGGFEAADRYCRDGAQIYYSSTAGAATITGAAQAWIGEGEGGFKATLLELKAKLERKKNARCEQGFTGSRPYWKICEACGLFPAAGSIAMPAGRMMACAPCELRWNEKRSPYLAKCIPFPPGSLIPRVQP